MTNWKRCIDFVMKWEGGFQNYHSDPGNWTGGEVGSGEQKGTKYGISAAAYPNLDIYNITKELAEELYRRDYYIASGADKLEWPLDLLVFDTAVLHGVGTATSWFEEVGLNPYAFAARRMRSYSKSDNFERFGRGWLNRLVDLMNTIGQDYSR